MEQTTSWSERGSRMPGTVPLPWQPPGSAWLGLARGERPPVARGCRWLTASSLVIKISHVDQVVSGVLVRIPQTAGGLRLSRRMQLVSAATGGSAGTGCV